jgi:hypothetical protein
VYAGKDGNVYRKDSSGNWSSNSGSGWEPVTKPQENQTGAARTSAYGGGQAQTQGSRQTMSTATQSRQPSTDWSSRESVQNLESTANSRQRGNQMSQRAGSAQTSGMSYGSPRSGGGGGGGRRSR